MRPLEDLPHVPKSLDAGDDLNSSDNRFSKSRGYIQYCMAFRALQVKCIVIHGCELSLCIAP